MDRQRKTRSDVRGCRDVARSFPVPVPVRFDLVGDASHAREFEGMKEKAYVQN